MRTLDKDEALEWLDKHIAAFSTALEWKNPPELREVLQWRLDDLRKIKDAVAAGSDDKTYELGSDGEWTE